MTNFKIIYDDTLEQAVRENNLVVTKNCSIIHIINYSDPLSLIFVILMDSLCSDIIKLLVEHYFGINDSLALFCTSKKFSVYQQLYSQILLDTKKGTAYCIVHGELDALKFIYRRTYIDIHAINEYFFESSYYCGHLNVVRWFIQLGIGTNSPININIDKERAFRYICESGHLNIVQWLVQLGIEVNSSIDIHVYDDYAFRYSCQNNHLDIAHWLIQLGIESNSLIDIHAYHDWAFRYSCFYGYLNIAQWLIQLGIEINSPIDIHTDHDHAFRLSCHNNHPDIAYWLIQLGIETNSPINQKIV